MRKFISISAPTFAEYAESQISELRFSGRFATADNYNTLLTSVTTFLKNIGHPVLRFREIDGVLVQAYNQWLRQKKNVRNSIACYNRTFRAIYNKAVKTFGLKDNRPFDKVCTGEEKSRSRAVDESVIKRIINADVKGDRALMLARDLFSFSYLCRGMPFVDMAYLRKSDIVGDYIIYNRHKTQVLLKVRIEPQIRKIIDRYLSMNENSDSPYLFPILKDTEGEQAYRKYRSGLITYNRNLKRLAAAAGVTVSISSYVARHSWASIAYNSDISIGVIKDSLGHTSESTTRTYVCGIKQEKLDEANRKMARKCQKFPFFGRIKLAAKVHKFHHFTTI